MIVIEKSLALTPLSLSTESFRYSKRYNRVSRSGVVSHARIHRGNLEARIEKERMITAGQDIHNHVGWVEEGGGRRRKIGQGVN